MIGGVIIKEYGIYIRQGTGKPYMLDIYSNIVSAKLKLFDMISLEEVRERPYFVDNDFFDNKYNIAIKLKYFCIKEREVTEWCKYSEEFSKSHHNNKILFFNDFRGC